MKLRYLLIIFILAFVSACNVAEQGPQVDNTQSASTNTSTNLANSNQIVNFRKARETVSENSSTLTVYVEREGTYLPDDQEIYIQIMGSADLSDLTIASPIQVENTDVTMVPTSPGEPEIFKLKFPGDGRNQIIEINVNDDLMYEIDEILQLQIINNPNKDYITNIPSMMAIEIENNDPIPSVSFASNSASLNENSAVDYTIDLNLSNPSYQDITIPVKVGSGSIANSQDHDFTEQSFTIPAESSAVTVSIDLEDDTYNELDELLILELGNPINANLASSPALHSLTILDDDGAPEYNLSIVDANLGEAGDTEKLILTLDPGVTLEESLDVPVTVAPTVLGEQVNINVDYSVSDNKFTFVPPPATDPDLDGDGNWRTSAVVITAINDSIYEQNESLTFTVTDTAYANAGPTDSIDVIVVDDEAAPVIEFVSPSYLSQEGATAFLPITITPASDEPITLSHTLVTGAGYATPVTDHSILVATATSFTIAAGKTSYQYPIMIHNDAVFDQDEKIDMTITHSSGHGIIGAQANSVITIKEAGSLPTISFDSSTQSTAESGIDATIDITMSTVSEAAISFVVDIEDINTERDGVNTPLDYDMFTAGSAGCTVTPIDQNKATVTILATNTTCTLAMKLLVDTLDEPTEQFSLTIQQPTNLVIGDYQHHTISILDINNPPNLSISINTSGTTNFPINEGSSENIIFELSQASGYDIIVNFTDDTIASASPIATLTDDYTVTAPGTILIPAGDTTHSSTVSLNAIADNLYESGGSNPADNEQIVVKVAAGSNYTIAAQDTITATIIDEDVNTPPVLSIQGVDEGMGDDHLDSSENDIVNITFKLSKPTSKDIVVYYDIDDTVACAAAVLADPNQYKCANIHNDPPNTDSQNLLDQLGDEVENITNGTLAASEGVVTIPAGETHGVVSFVLDTDNLFENSSHITGGTPYTRREQFRVAILDVLDKDDLYDTDTITSTATIDATIDTNADYIDINITDLDVTPVAFFLNPYTKSQNEASTTISIPINVTSKSETLIKYHIQILQPVGADLDAGHNMADENDFDVSNGGTNNEITDNVDGVLTVITEDNTDGAPHYANEALLYSDDGDTGDGYIIMEGDFSIATFQTTDTLVITLDNDDLYEGNEQFIVRIVPDAPLVPPATIYSWGISSNNEYKVTINESQSYPTVSFTSTTPFTITEGTADKATINLATTTFLAMSLPRTTYNIAFESTPVHQHEVVTFDIGLTGTATNAVTSLTNFKESYMLSDYLTFWYNTTNGPDVVPSYNTATDAVGIKFQPGSGFTTSQFPLEITQDFRYEPVNDTIVATIQNLNNVNFGTTTQLNLDIDGVDDMPIIVSDDTFSGSYDEADTNGFKLILRDVDGYFNGKYITQADATLEYSNDGILRQGGGNTGTNTGTINFNAANDYSPNFGVSPSTLGFDPRTVNSVSFALHTPTEALLHNTIETAQGNGLTYNATATLFGLGVEDYEGTYSLTFKDLDVELAIASDLGDTSVTIHGVAETKYTALSHTCTHYRGLASCFGYNNHGQLGRGSSVSYGLNPGDDLHLQSSALDLGTDSLGNQLYVKDMAVGKSHTCAVFGNGSVKCWGDNSYGQLGRGDTASNIGTTISNMGDNLPFVDLGPGEEAVSIYAGAFSNCVILKTGKAKCWGDNTYGQLGIESTVSKGGSTSDMGSNLQQVYMSSTEKVLMMTAGAHHYCSLNLKSGAKRLRCWGRNANGELGLNSGQNSVGEAPNEMASTYLNLNHDDLITNLEAGAYHTCATFGPSGYDTKFNTRCWGDNHYGQLGLGRLVRAAMFVKDDLLSYTSAANACSYHMSNGNNCTARLGKDQPAYTGYESFSTEEVTPGGHQNGGNYIMQKPSYGTTTGTIDVDVYQNQFVQLYYPVHDLALGSTSSCGVVKTNTFAGGDGTGVGPALTVRCWGSNYVVKDGDFSETGSHIEDFGMLNNHGHSVYYEPLADAHDGFFRNALIVGATAANTTSRCALSGGGYHADICDFINHFKIIGDDVGKGGNGQLYSILSGIYSEGNIYNMLAYQSDTGGFGNFNYGYSKLFPGSFYIDGVHPFIHPSFYGINHEMHANSHSKFSFAGATDIKIKGGAHNTCALIKTSALGANDGSNKSIKCWGSNYAGQSGVDYTGHTGCSPHKIGNAWGCGEGGTSGAEISFNYSF